MKKYRTKPWAKGLACRLFVLAMTVSVICLGNVRWLAYHGGYQWEGTRQLVEEEEAFWVENLTSQLAGGYRAIGPGTRAWMSRDMWRMRTSSLPSRTWRETPFWPATPWATTGRKPPGPCRWGHGPMESY